MRKKIIAGNWKMNKSPKEAAALIQDLKAKVNSNQSDVVFCVPYVDLPIALDLLKDTPIAVGAQNLYYKDEGPYTGEITAGMLADMGVQYVIIGHSERRQNFGETDASVNLKIQKALKAGLIPICCVGESQEQFGQNVTIELVRMQVKIALFSVSEADARKVVIAYEPIWAIGTGLTATSMQAEEVCAAIRKVIAEMYNSETAEAIRIQYGGSINAANAKELFTMPNIDGGLVGGASLKPEFESIVNYEL